VPRIAARLIEDRSQKGNTPSAARSSSAAGAQLAGDARTMDSQMVEDLALRHVEAQAEFIVELHGDVRFAWRSGDAAQERQCGPFGTGPFNKGPRLRNRIAFDSTS
jgi:hypothetical protein